jgi:hypothetical protein
MTIRTFWAIVLKIQGIWLVLDSFKVIPQFIGTLYSFSENPDMTLQMFVWTFLYLFSTIGIYILVLWLFVFKTAWLIDKLHLVKGFSEERIELNIPRSVVLSITIIIIGGIMFVDSFPLLCNQIFSFLQQKNMFRMDPKSGMLIFQAVKTVLGYLLMTNSQIVVNIIDKKKVNEHIINE